VAARPRRLLSPAHPPGPPLKTLLFRLLPGALLLGATVALLTVPALTPLASALLPAYPAVVLLAAALLAWRFTRWRVLVATLTLAGAERALAVTLPSASPVAHVVAAATATALPLNLTALAWLPERARVAFGWGVGLVAVEALATTLLSQPEAAPLAETLIRPVAPGARLPIAALVAFAGALGLAGLRIVLRPLTLECGAFWALLAALLAFVTGSAAAASLALGGAGLILLVSLIEASHAIAYGDELTGLPSRRALTEALAGLEGVYTIAMVDIDHFKIFNDTYGHDAGDQLLRMVGARLAEVAGGGRPFRYGGEEFAVIFTDTRLDDALPFLEELRKRIETSGFGLRGPDRPRQRGESKGMPQPTRRVSVSVSIGAAEPGRRETRPQEVLDAADAALYRAKRSGRNRLCT
jgi:diguanylate cyclase (GGDEF)-like protein